MKSTPYDDLFRETEKKYGLARGIMKAIAFVESSFNPKAYRFEPGLWERIKGDPMWADRDPRQTAASFGLIQILYTTAVGVGYVGEAEGLYVPEVNLDYGGKYLRILLNEAWRDKSAWYGFDISAMDTSLARWNGGPWKNPDGNGTLRNQSYVNKVMAALTDIRRGGGQ